MMGNIKMRINILKQIYPYIKKYNALWALLAVFKFGQKMIFLAWPLVLKIFIEKVIENRNISFMLYVVLMIIGIYVLDTGLRLGHRVIDNKIFNGIVMDLRQVIFRKYLSIPLKQIEQYQMNDLVRRLNWDIDMVKFFIIGQVFDVLSYIFSIGVALIMIWVLDWHVFIVAVIFIPISILLSLKCEKDIQKNAERDRILITEIEEETEKMTAAWKEIKANHLEKKKITFFSDLLSELYECRTENTDIEFKRRNILDKKEKVIDILGMYMAGGIFHVLFNITASTVIASVGYYNSILQYMRELIETNATLKIIKPSVDRVMEFLNMEIPDRQLITKDNDELCVFEIEDVSFWYVNGEKIFDKLYLKIFRGDKILLEGNNGSGKSTLMNILTHELIPQEGKILFYGKDIQEIQPEALYIYLRKVDTLVYFMDISVKEFLKMAKKDATEEEMKEACIATNLWEDLWKKEDGLEFVIGKDGSNLSMGQKQKLVLARLFLLENKILLLDEVFSAIDVMDKVQICNRLMRKYEQEIVICISHDVEIKKKFAKLIPIERDGQKTVVVPFVSN